MACTKADNFIIPKNINFADKIYIFIDYLNSNYFTFRCKYRPLCKVVIKMHKDQLFKYNTNEECQIKYTITSAIKEHSFSEKNSKDLIINNNANIKKIIINRDLAKNII